VIFYRAAVRAVGPVCVDCASSLNYRHFDSANARIAYRVTTLLLASIYFSSSLSLSLSLSLSRIRFYFICSVKPLDTSRRDKLGRASLKPRDRLICEVTRRINGGKVAATLPLLYLFLPLPFFLSILFSFPPFFSLSTPREITYRETVESVHDGSFIG